jgi:Glycosyl hydrolase family 79 C-terminal beta domain
MKRSRRPIRSCTIAAVIVLALLSFASEDAGESTGASPVAVVSILAPLSTGVRIHPGFVGLSFEFPAVRAYTGPHAAEINPVLVQLIRNLAPGQSPSLRIGGDTTDSTWWPVRGVVPPPGVKYRLTPAWLKTTRALARDVGASLVLGVNLAIDRPALAAAEARALLAGIGTSSVAALEIGNEPDIYNHFPRHRVASGQTVSARPATYDLAAFLRQASRVGQALPPATLAGPAFGNVGWMLGLRRSLAAQPRLGLVTFHRYPLSCFARPGSSRYPTIGNLLSDNASAGLADSVAPFVAIAHSRGLRFRVDELNSVACGGARGVSNTFASALWMLNTLFELARVGVDGVNVHTLPGARYQPFAFSHSGGHWGALVYPEYYGLLMFAQAAPVGSRLLPVRGSAGRKVELWATLAPDRTARVVLINRGGSTARIALSRPAWSTRQATAERLDAPSLAATGDVTLGGQSFGTVTHTGSLGKPKTTTIDGSSGRYELTLPPASATLLTL